MKYITIFPGPLGNKSTKKEHKNMKKEDQGNWKWVSNAPQSFQVLAYELGSSLLKGSDKQRTKLP